MEKNFQNQSLCILSKHTLKKKRKNITQDSSFFSILAPKNRDSFSIKPINITNQKIFNTNESHEIPQRGPNQALRQEECSAIPFTQGNFHSLSHPEKRDEVSPQTR